MPDDARLKADRIIDALEKAGLIDSWSPLGIEKVRQTIVRTLSPEQPTFECLALAVTEGPDDAWPADYWQQFWDAYPRKVSSTSAKKALDKIRKTGKVEFANILVAVEVYRHETRNTEMRFIMHPSTWINAGRWKDDPLAISGSHANGRGEVKNGFLGRLMD